MSKDETKVQNPSDADVSEPASRHVRDHTYDSARDKAREDIASGTDIMEEDDGKGTAQSKEAAAPNEAAAPVDRRG